MNEKVKAARLALVNAVRLHMPAHTSVAAEAVKALDVAMNNLCDVAVTVALDEAKVPQTPPPVPPRAVRTLAGDAAAEAAGTPNEALSDPPVTLAPDSAQTPA